MPFEWVGIFEQVFRDPARPPRTPSSDSGSNFVKKLKNKLLGCEAAPAPQPKQDPTKKFKFGKNSKPKCQSYPPQWSIMCKNVHLRKNNKLSKF
jgi:hypothetical protein